MIADKGLRKFYEHLDSINKQEVSAFQMYNRVREQFRSQGGRVVTKDGTDLPASLPFELKLFTNNKIADVS